MEREKQKILYLEILRVIAVFGVLFCHTGTEGIHHYLETESHLNYWFGILAVSVSQYCVPLFFMITGALLLRREETIAYVYRHRVIKMIFVICFAVFLQYMWNIRDIAGYEFDLKFYFRLLYEGGAATPQWFLYTYLSLMLALPFLQKLVRVIPKKSWFLYLFVAWEVINGLFPIIAYYQGWNETPLELSMFSNSVICCVLGYFVEHHVGDFFYKEKNIRLLFGVTILLMAETMHLNDISIPDNGYGVYSGLFAPVYALLIYVTVRYICYRWKCPRVLEKIFCFAGGGVFGVYLIEGMLRETFHFVYLNLNTRIYSYPATFVWIFVCVLVGILIANLFKKIPVIGRLI